MSKSGKPSNRFGNVQSFLVKNKNPHTSISELGKKEITGFLVTRSYKRSSTKMIETPYGIGKKSTINRDIRTGRIIIGSFAERYKETLRAGTPLEFMRRNNIEIDLNFGLEPDRETNIIRGAVLGHMGAASMKGLSKENKLALLAGGKIKPKLA